MRPRQPRLLLLIARVASVELGRLDPAAGEALRQIGQKKAEAAAQARVAQRGIRAFARVGREARHRRDVLARYATPGDKPAYFSACRPSCARSARVATRRRGRSTRLSGVSRASAVSCLRARPPLRAAREHSVGLVDAERHEVVDQDADICLGPGQDQRLLAREEARGVDARDESLGRRLLVARAAVGLARDEEAGDELGLERGEEERWVEVVVLDRVGWPRDDGAPQSRECCG